MNLRKMSRKEYEKFQLLVNVSVLTVFIAAFLFVEFTRVDSMDIASSLAATIVISSIFLILGVLTIIPEYRIYVATTLIAFSFIMAASQVYSMRAAGLNLWQMIELLLALVLFMYGVELKSNDRKFITLKALIS